MPHAKTLTIPPSLTQMRLAVAGLAKAGQVKRAMSLAERSQDAMCHTVLAATLAENGQLEAACQSYRFSLGLAPVPEAREGLRITLAFLAAQAFARQEWPLAEQALDEAVSLDPAWVEGKRMQGALKSYLVMKDISVGSYDQAIPGLEKLQKESPSRPDVAHQLAMLYHRRAIEHDSDVRNDSDWERAFACWAMVLASETYWKQWGETRSSIYETEIPIAEIERLRRELLRNVIRDIHTAFIRLYGEAGREADLARHKTLRARWLLEFECAQALEQTLQVQAEPELFASGPLTWQALNQTARVEQLATKVLALQPDFAPAQVLMDGLGATGLARLLLKDGQPDAAVALLDEQVKKNPQETASRNLLVECLEQQARNQALVDLPGAIACWIRARNLGAPAGGINEMITKSVLEAVRKADQAGNLDQAESYLNAGLEAVPDSRSLRDHQVDLIMKQVSKVIGNQMDGDPVALESALVEARRILGRASIHARDSRKLQEFRRKLARDVTNRAVGMVNELSNLSPYEPDRRARFCQTLLAAEALLKQAEALDPAAGAIKTNLQQVRLLRIQTGC